MRKLTRFVAVFTAVAALGLVACDDDDEPTQPGGQVQSVSVTPQNVTIDPGGQVQLAAQVQTTGDVSTDVEWSSADPSVASVNDEGLVTGEGAGTTTVTATSTADDSKTAAAAITVRDLEEASVSIQTWKAVSSTFASFVAEQEQTEAQAQSEIANPDSVGTAVSHEFARLVVTANLNEGDQTISEVDLLLNGEVASSQNFSTSSDVQGQTAPSEIDLAVNSDHFSGDLVGNTVVGDWPNATYMVGVQITLSDGTVKTASNTFEISFQNNHQFVLRRLEGGNTATDDEGDRWWGGTDITWAVTPIIYTDDVTLDLFTVDPSHFDIIPGLAGAPDDPLTLDEEPYTFTTTADDNAGLFDDSPFQFDVEDPRTDEGEDFGQATNVDWEQSGFGLRLDWAAPTASDAIQVAHANDYLSQLGYAASPTTASSSANGFSTFFKDGPFVPESWTDDGIEVVGDHEFIVHWPASSPSDSVFPADSIGQLDERTSDQYRVAMTRTWDALMNVQDDPVDLADTTEAFGVDRGAPEVDDALPEEDIVFNGDGTSPENNVLFSAEDIPLTDFAGSPGSGVVRDFVLAVIVNPTTDQPAQITAGPSLLAPADPTDFTYSGSDFTLDVSPSSGLDLGDGEYSITIVAPDSARSSNQGIHQFQFTLDTSAPTFGPLDPVPSGSSGTQATAVVQSIGGTIEDMTAIAQARLSVFVDGTDAQGSGSDGSCTTDDYKLSVNAGEIDRNDVDLTNGTNSISFEESFEIADPFPNGTGTVTYCYIIQAADGALDNEGNTDRNRSSLTTRADITWNN